MDSATPCLHKGHIFGSIKLVVVFFLCTFAHAHSAMGKLYIITAISSLNASTFKTVYQTFKFDFRFLPYSALDSRT